MSQVEAAQRPWIAAGAALTMAGAVTVAPVVIPALPQAHLADVQLTADFDPVGPWMQVLEHSAENAGGLFDAWSAAPFPVLQQLAVNQVDHLQELLAGNVDVVLNDIVGNLQGAVTAPFTFTDGLGLLNGTDDIALSGTGVVGALTKAFEALRHLLGIELSHQTLFEFLMGATGGNPLVEFTASPLSGLLLGAAGPVISPALALGSDVGAIIDGLTGSDPDVLGAFGDVVNIPAHMTDAFLNGGEMLNAGPLIMQLPGMAGFLDKFVTVNELGLEMGGLFSPNGSLFNAFGFNASTPDIKILFDWINLGHINVDFPGHAVGPLGALIGLPQAIAAGMGWDPTGDMPLAGLDLFNASTAAASETALPDLGFLTDGLNGATDLLSGLSGDLSAGLGDLFGADLAGMLGVDTLGDLLANLPGLLLGMLLGN